MSNSLSGLVESRSPTTATASETIDKLPTLDHNTEENTTENRLTELQAELQMADNLAIRLCEGVESFSVGLDIAKVRMSNDNSELSEKADALEIRLGEVETARNTSNAKADYLIRKVHDLRDRLKGHEDTENKSLTQQIESKSALIKGLDEFEDELNDTKEDRDTSVAQVHELQAEKRFLTQKNSELQEELNIVKRSRNSSVKISSHLIADDKVFSHRVCSLEELFNAFQKVHDQGMDSEISMFSDRMEILRAQLDQAERERDLAAEKTHTKILQKFELQREELQKEFSSLLLEKMNATTNLQVIQGQLDELEKARQFAERQAAVSAEQVSKIIQGNKVLDMRVQGMLIAHDITRTDAGNPWQHLAKDLTAYENCKGTVSFQAESMGEHDVDYESTNDLLVQIQVLKNALAQEQSAHGLSMTQLSQAELKVDTLEASLAGLRTQRSNSSPEAVESIILELQSSLAVKVTAHEICQLRLASVKATLKDLQRSVAEEASEKKAINARKKENNEASLKSLQTSLENERKILQICHHKLDAAEARANEQATSDAIHLEKIANLENKLELWRGLVDVGILARFAYWQSAKKYCDINGNWYQDRGSNVKSKSFIAETTKKATARPHIAADAALFLLGILSEEPDRRMFFDIYQTELCSTIREQAHPRLLAEIATSKAAVRERSRAYGLVEQGYEKSGQLLKLEKKCMAKYLHMSSATGSSELKAVQDEFDAERDVKEKVQTIQQIADSAMRNSC
ncbi:hypothetical protein QTJ16_001055 [Diplocarpon rosae]|uniref:Uncharacterized protein n=1 Tax=Diplocarpon rosae TaxID=946125 RepID=A0AAD9T6G4_9HELO|nr:hypothetical protein QTJ16_001055 [Diplocarpon rosae]